MNRKKISDKDKIEKSVSGPMKELTNSNIAIQQFVQLCKEYSKGSQEANVVTREDLWKLYTYINENSTYKADIKHRKFQKCHSNYKNAFSTYHAFKNKKVMLDIAKEKFTCLNFGKKLHHIDNFCKN